MPPKSSASTPASSENTVCWVDASTLTPHPKNPHQGDVDAVAASLMQHGFIDPVTVWKGTIYAGHTRCKAALFLKSQGKVIPGAPNPGFVKVLEASFTDETQALSYLLADNTTAYMGVFDNALLQSLHADLAEAKIPLADFGASLTELADWIPVPDVPAFAPQSAIAGPVVGIEPAKQPAPIQPLPAPAPPVVVPPTPRSEVVQRPPLPEPPAVPPSPPPYVQVVGTDSSNDPTKSLIPNLSKANEGKDVENRAKMFAIGALRGVVNWGPYSELVAYCNGKDTADALEAVILAGIRALPRAETS